MLEFLKFNPNLVIVGGFSLYLRGLKSSYTDIDVVALRLTGALKGAQTYETDSIYSQSGKRGFLSLYGVKVDIFIEDDLPEWDMVQDMRCVSLRSMLQYYETILPHVRDNQRPYVLNLIKLITCL